MTDPNLAQTGKASALTELEVGSFNGVQIRATYPMGTRRF